MVKRIDKQKLDLLLEKGMITPKEYQYLLKNPKIIEEQEAEVETSVARSIGKNIISFILTIAAIGCILFGTCIMNMAIVHDMRSDALIGVLMVAWPLFPIILFGWLAHKTKNAGMKWAVIVLTIIALWFLAMAMG